jgi:hypothetical protein
VIQIGEQSVAVWFFPVRLIGAKGDYLAHAERLPDGGTRCLYRHRWYASGADQDPWNGRDTKSWHEIRTKEAPAIFVAKFDEATRAMAWIGGAKPDEFYFLERGTMTADEFLETFLRCPFVSRKPVSLHEPGHA